MGRIVGAGDNLANLSTSTTYSSPDCDSPLMGDATRGLNGVDKTLGEMRSQDFLSLLNDNATRYNASNPSIKTQK